MTGAVMERGRIIRLCGDGTCIVQGIDSPGIVTMPLKMMSADAASEGDTVLFCEFADGCGAVIMKL